MGSIESDEKSGRLRDQTPQSIPLADLEGELRISSLSIMTAKSMQSIQSYHGSMKVIEKFCLWYLSNGTSILTNFNIWLIIQNLSSEFKLILLLIVDPSTMI